MSKMAMHSLTSAPSTTAVTVRLLLLLRCGLLGLDGAEVETCDGDA